MQTMHEALIRAVYDNLPEHVNPATMIADALQISREAAYRRIRGEVQFSLNETVLLASRMNFSLDHALNSVSEGSILFQLRFSDLKNPLDTYNGILESDIRLFREAESDPETVFAVATNTIPEETYLGYKNLAKFKLYEWLTLHGLCGPDVRTFEDLQVPERFSRICRDYAESAKAAARTSYLFSKNCMGHWLDSIRCFQDMRLISAESVHDLKCDLLKLLDEVEQIATEGRFDNGHEVFLFLSDTDIETTCSCIATSRGKAVSIELFSLNALRTADEGMYECVELGIRRQSRFATLISGCGERDRVHFFKLQRARVEELEREGV